MRRDRTSWDDEKTYTLKDYLPDDRVGALLGVETSPNHFLCDFDYDWGPGTAIAQALMPASGFTYGHGAKRLSHRLYTCPQAIPTIQYRDIGDKEMLCELRGTKADGSIGYQSMVPPSVWSKDGRREPLTFVGEMGTPAHVDDALLKRRVMLVAVGMLLAKNLNKNGFGHEARLAWAGFLLRAGVTIEELVMMGEGISIVCDNREVSDVRLVVRTTAENLKNDDKKVTGGPALAKLLGAHGKAIVARITEWLGGAPDEIEKLKGRSHVSKLINLVIASGAELFTTPSGDLYATMPAGGHTNTLPLTDRAFREWLAHEYFKATRTGISGGAITDAITTLSGIARDSGIQHHVYTRVAAVEDRVYLDLARDDRHVLTISADGWEVTSAPTDIRFVRRLGMLPLPLPQRSDQSVADLLASVLNLKADSTDMMLLVGWQVAALRGRKPFPILMISGEHGSAKSYASRLSRQLIDPNLADLGSPPKDARDS